MGRKKHNKELKARIALDAAPDIFTRGKDKEAERDRLYKKV